MIVYDIFEHDGVRLDDCEDTGERRYLGTGEVWVATVSSKEVAVEYYCRDAVNVVRPREGEVSECEDLEMHLMTA